VTLLHQIRRRCQLSEGFWTINVGQLGVLVAVAALGLTVISMHRSNTDKIKQNAEELGGMKQKLDTIYQWFYENVLRGDPRA